MIDWHSHILPGMDDGSRNVTESVSLVDMQASQGVGTVIATPHFYANDETVDSFLDRRRNAYERLKVELWDSAPEILLGAEVRYYQGISRMDQLNDLKIQGSKLLLLEMPVSCWSEYMVKELIEMSGRSTLRLVLAHVERYLALQKHSVWERIFDSDILIQSNASFFTSLISRHKALSLLKQGNIHLLGSDCHNLTIRRPQIGKAFHVIQKKLGEDYLQQMDEYAYSLLAANNI